MLQIPRRRAARMWPLLPTLILLAAVVFSGCELDEYKPRAVGKEGEVIVVIDSSRWNGPIGDALKSTVGEYIGTLPAPERRFDLRAMDLQVDQDLSQVRNQKNVIFVAPLSDSTNEAIYLRNVFDSSAQEAIMSGDGVVVGRNDLWRRDQRVFYITGQDTDAVVDAIDRRAEEITRTFDEATRQRLTEEMFDKGRQTDIEEYLMGEHGFAVNVQHDYLIAIDTTNFVWLRRILADTWRSLFIWYDERANPADLTPEWIYATRDSLTREYVQGNLGGWAEIHRHELRPLISENIDFLGHYGFETRGLWRMVGEENGEFVEFGGGGPFVNYTFYDRASGRIYMIDGMVFAPGYEKREFLRQMEVIAHTFRTAEGEESDEPMEAAAGMGTSPDTSVETETQTESESGTGTE